MWQQRFFNFALFLLLILTAKSVSSAESPSIAWHEDRLAEIDAELNALARYSVRGGVGTIGYRSPPKKEPNHDDIWIEIELATAVPIDQIILVPCLTLDAERGLISDGIPEEFHIIAGTDSDREGKLIATFNASDKQLPRIGPIVIDALGMNVSWVRIQPTRLSSRMFDDYYIFQLSECLIFSDEKNVALHQPVHCSPSEQSLSGPWHRSNLVDGFTPYLMDSAQGPQGRSFTSKIDEGPVITLDLQDSFPISRIHLHEPSLSSTIPQGRRNVSEIPLFLKIEGANRPDFSDAFPLLETKFPNEYTIGPIMMWNIPEASCRYIRITGRNHPTNPRQYFTRLSFTEIELFADEINVALGKMPLQPASFINYRERLPRLTDGRNLYGNILPIREWLNQLAQRHELETERPIVATKIAQLYEHQTASLRWMTWLAIILAAGTAISLLTAKVFRLRTITQTQQRIAANLHDELGANLNAIGLLGDYAQNLIEEAKQQPPLEELSEVVKEVRSLTEETGETARHCSNLLEAKGHHQDLIEDIKRTSNRLLADMEHEMLFTNENLLADLPHRKRIDLALFYKECLNNIVRHAEATKVITKITGTSSNIFLIIQDNGLGLAADAQAKVPASIKRRAKLAGGKVLATTPPEGGTLITLRIRTHRFFG